MRWPTLKDMKFCPSRDGKAAPPPRHIETIVASVKAELKCQQNEASRRLNDPHFVNGRTGKTVAKDEMMALAFLEAIDLEAGSDEEPENYVTRIIERAREAKEDYISQEDDDDGFGVGI